MQQRVLFLCTGNSARSQMAEGWLRQLAAERFEAHSAGTAPRAEVHPLAIQVMAECGVDIAAQRPKDLQPYRAEPWDVVITVCDRAKESCPLFPGAHQQLHWSFRDPAEAEGTPEERLAVFRRVRDEILARLRLFVSAQTHAAIDPPASGEPPRA